MSHKYYHVPKVKTNLPNKFIYLARKKIDLKIADFIIRINFCPVLNRSYLKSLFKELVVYTLLPFEVNPSDPIIDANIFIRDKETIQIASKEKDSVYVHIFDSLKKYIMESTYNLSLNHFSILLAELLNKLLSSGNGFIIHASSVMVGKKAIIFIAPSGTGKSTVMGFLSSRFTPLGDDSGIIRKYNNKYYFYQTPFIEKESWINKGNKRYLVGKIYFIKQGNKLTSLKMDKTQVLEKMMLLVPEFTKRYPNMIKSMLSFINDCPDSIFEELEFPYAKEKVNKFFSKIYNE